MITNLASKITDSLVEVGAVTSEDKELYSYGIRLGILLVINVATAVLIGLLLGMVWQSIIFLLAYNPIRSYAGGYHARSPLNCYLLSIPMMLAVLLGIRMLPWTIYLTMAAIFSAVLVIEILAPVQDQNKPLNDREKVVYKRRARVYTVILSGVAVLLWMIKMEQSSLSVVMALVVAAIMLMLGAAKNRKLNKEKA